MDFSFDFMALKISKQVSDRFLVSMAMIIILELLIINYRRKFRSQASDNMDRWKGRGGKNQRREEKRRGGRRSRRRSEKRKSQKKEGAGARKGRKVAKHCVFQCLVAPEGRKVGSLKRRVWSRLGR